MPEVEIRLPRQCFFCQQSWQDGDLITIWKNRESGETRFGHQACAEQANFPEAPEAPS